MDIRLLADNAEAGGLGDDEEFLDRLDELLGRGPLGLASDLVHEQGVGTLARGVGLRIAYYAPLVGAWFGLYEAFRGALDSVGQ